MKPFPLLILLFCLLPTLAQTPQAVDSLTLSPYGRANASPHRLITFGDFVYFIADTSSASSLLHRSQGHAADTHPVLSNGAPITVQTLQLIHDVLYFLDIDDKLGYVTRPGKAPVLTDITIRGEFWPGEHGILFKNDNAVNRFSPREGLFAYPPFLPNLDTPPTTSNPIEIAGVVYQILSGYGDRILLVQSDGSAAGTGILKELYSDPLFDRYLATSSQLLAVGAHIYLAFNYQTEAGPTGQVWISDRSEAGTQHQLTYTEPGAYYEAVQLKGAWRDGVLVAHNQGFRHELIALDSGGPELLFAGDLEGDLINPTPRGQDFFFSDTRNLYRLDAAGHFDQLPGGPGTIQFGPWAYPLFVDRAGLVHCFYSDDSVAEHWVHDGTPAGSHKLEYGNNLTLGAWEITQLGDSLFMVGNLGSSDLELLVVRDPQAPEVIELNPRIHHFGISSTALGERLLYVDPGEPQTLRISDGSPTGTKVLAELDDTPFSAVVAGDAAYFWNSGATGLELWRSGGSAETSAPIWSAQDPATVRGELIASANAVFFSTTPQTQVREIWRLDGGTGAALKLATVAHAADLGPLLLGDSAGGAFLLTSDPNAHHIRYSGPQETGFTELASLPPYRDYYGRQVSLEYKAGHAWFKFSTYVNGRFDTLWVSDTTPAGTFLYIQNVDLSNMIVHNNLATMVVNGADTFGLAQTDGSAPFTDVTSQTGIRGYALWDAGDDPLLYGSDGGNIWVSDGSPDGTHELLDLPSSPTPILRWDTEVGTLLVLREYFSGLSAYLTDGSPEGTRPLFQSPLDQSATYYDVAVQNGTLYVSATLKGTTRSGQLMAWRPGDQALQPFAEAQGLEEIRQLDQAGDHLFFPGMSPDHELLLYALGSEPSQPRLEIKNSAWFFTSNLIRLYVEPVEGASYHWSLEGARFVGDSQDSSVLLRLDADHATVHLRLELASGENLEADLELRPSPIEPPTRGRRKAALLPNPSQP